MQISREDHLVTLINVFETKPEQQQELIDQWIRFVDSVKREPGMIGTALHRSKDGTRVVNYAHHPSKRCVIPLQRVVENDPDRMAMSGADTADPVSQIDPINPTCPLHRSVMDGESHRVALP